ncbi:hypothetical protein AVEN_72586-1 [Araneus ventricosus]|uniref:Uncharacterized protein n=1 Tax=Araneus ventricosus TaxID=182803 RepID=A0A4Y2SLR7_ARAVE|nr:hypothetical protein AVEN_72586-1 [Araneus ventricosus]
MNPITSKLSEELGPSPRHYMRSQHHNSASSKNWANVLEKETCPLKLSPEVEVFRYSRSSRFETNSRISQSPTNFPEELEDPQKDTICRCHSCRKLQGHRSSS